MVSKKSRKLLKQPTLSTSTSSSPPKSKGFLSYPVEVFTMILKLSPSSSLGNLRMVHREFDEPATRYLFERIWISPAKTDRKKLTAIAAHPYLSTLVKELAYDATNATRNRPYPLDALEHFAYLQTCMLIPNLTQAAIKRGYEDYRSKRQEEWNLRLQGKKHLTKQGRLPKDFKAIMEQPQNHQQIIPYLADDLAALVSTLRSLVNLKSLVVSDDRHKSNRSRLRFKPTLSEWNRVHPGDAVETDFWEEFTYRITDPNVRGKDTLLVDPFPWFDNRGSNCKVFLPHHHRGFAVLFQAASMAGLNSIESFQIERGSDFSGISYHVLDMSPTQLHHAKRALQGLKKIELKINGKSPSRKYKYTDPPELPSWDVVSNKGRLAEALAASTRLEELSIMLDKTNCCTHDPVTGSHTCGNFEGPAYQTDTTRIPQLEKLVGTHTWTALRSVTLGHMAIDEGDLLAFLNRHAQTLRRLRMVQMEVITDKGYDVTEPFSGYRWALTYADGNIVRLDSLIIE